jgi:two-component system LytT family response regulator
VPAIRVLIVDDEALGRKVVRDFLKEHADIEIVGEAKDGRDALEQIEEKSPDLVFLDIQMPGLNGFEVVEQLANPPVIIFSTAYDEYAIKAFEVNAVDYLLKPCAKERFSEAMDRARAALSSRPADAGVPMRRLLEDIRRDTDYLGRLLIKEGPRITIVNLDDVLWLESGDDYVTIHVTGGKSHLVTHTLSGLEARLDPRKFIRVHRSAIINLSRVSQIVSLDDGRYEVTLSDGQRVITSRSGGRTLRDLTL